MHQLRQLTRTPAFTLTALAALMLGIGANTAIFSVIDAVLLKPLGYPDPDRIVQFLATSPEGVNAGSSATRFNAWRRLGAVFQDVTAYEYNSRGLNLAGGANPEQVRAIRVSAGYFHLLGAPLVTGRTFTAEEDRPNAGPRVGSTRRRGSAHPHLHRATRRGPRLRRPQRPDDAHVAGRIAVRQHCRGGSLDSHRRSAHRSRVRCGARGRQLHAAAGRRIRSALQHRGPALHQRQLRWPRMDRGHSRVLRPLPHPVLRGRAFTDRDDARAPRVAVINQAIARRFWPDYPRGRNPLDDLVILGKGYGPEFAEPARQIVGIVADVHDAGLNRHPEPMVYVPMAQVADGITALVVRAASIAWIARTRAAPNALRTAIGNELRQVSGGLPLEDVRTMDEIRSRSTAREDFHLSLLTIFSAAALLLAAIGIHGLMAYTVQQRTREIGVRLALGADPAGVGAMVVWQGMRLAALGVALGTAAAFPLVRLMSAFLFGVAPRDPLVFVTVPVFLGAVVLFSVWLPARRASRIDPLAALRAE